MRFLVALTLCCLLACGDGDALPRSKGLSTAAVKDASADDLDATMSGETAVERDDGEPSIPDERGETGSLQAMASGQGEPDTTLSTPTDASQAPHDVPDGMDSGTAADVTSGDDAAIAKAGFTAAGPLDAGLDAELDAGVDAGLADASLDAAGSPDSGNPDSGNPDSGNPDSALGPETDGGAGDTLIHARLLERMQACEALGPGEYHRAPIIDDRMRCISECVIAATCSDVRHFFCGEEAPSIDDCQFECPVVPVAQPFSCGDGQQVWRGFACDGLKDCVNARDEQDCPTFTCANGQLVTGPARCDGRRRCSDGSDELGCASTCLSPSN